MPRYFIGDFTVIISLIFSLPKKEKLAFMEVYIQTRHLWHEVVGEDAGQHGRREQEGVGDFSAAGTEHGGCRRLKVELVGAEDAEAERGGDGCEPSGVEQSEA